MPTLLDLLQQSLQPAIDTILCGNPSIPNLLLAIGAPPPDAIANLPLLGPLLVPATCTPRPVEIPPQFTGGQCADLVYNVLVRSRLQDGSIRDVNVASIQGPILRVENYWENFTGFNPGPYPYFSIIAPNQGGATPGEEEFGPLTSGPDRGYDTRSWIVSVTPTPFGPDICGNPPPQFPRPRGNEFGPFTLPPINIEIPGFGPVSFGGSVTFRPSINLPILGGIHVPVTVNLNANAVLSVPISFPVYLRLPSLEINGGISFTNNLNIAPSINFPRGGGSDCCDCDDIREIVQEELDEKFPPRRPFNSIASSFEAAQSRTITLEPFTYRVDLVLNQIPANAKIQWGVDAPDVYYAGWYSFGEGVNSSPRRPIHYERNVLYPEHDSPDNFTYTLPTGYTGTVTVYRYQEV